MTVMSTGLSGLLAFQRALATTSHNIANSSTEGYSRQSTEFATNTPNRYGSSFIGQGVYVSSVRRIQSDLVDAQLRTSLSNSSYADVRSAMTGRSDSLLSDEATGLAPVMETYFSSLQDVADDPTSLSARTVLLNDADTLAKRLAALDQQLGEQRTAINGQIAVDVDEINQYAQSLATLNRQIVSGYSLGSPPNDLLDQRDQILGKLAEKLDVKTTTQDDGSIDVFVGNGQALVMGATANEMVADHLSGDPYNLDIGIKSGTSTQPIDVTRFMTGGELGALLETRTEVVDKAQNTLGLIGLNLATQFNDQNHLGLDLNGELGGDIFALPEVSVSARTGNTATGALGVTIADVGQLTASDYRLQYDGTGYRLTRLPDSEVVTLDPDTAVPPDPNVFYADGLRIDTNTIAGAQAGDSWLIQPTRFAASGIEVTMTEPEDIAAAAAVTANTSVLNTGAATIQDVRAIDATDANLLTRAVVSYDATTASYSLDGVPIPATDVTVDDDGFTTIEANGWQLQLKGTPADGDEFVVSSNVGQTGDNRNLLAMLDLQDAKTIQGQATYQDGYSSLVADVGTQARQAQIMAESATAVLDDAQTQRDSLSGVNLDEEAANVIRFQQAYQAAGQVIATAGTMFDTLLQILRG